MGHTHTTSEERESGHTPASAVAEWLNGIRSLDRKTRERSCAALWNTFEADVRRVARIEHGIPGFSIENDDDIAVRVFATTFAALADGRYPDVQSRQELWGVLSAVTKREASRLRARHYAKKRGALQKISLEKIHDDRAFPCPQSVLPYFRIQITDLIASVANEEQQTIIQLIEYGYTVREIARQIHLSKRTVERRLAELRRVLAVKADGLR